MHEEDYVMNELILILKYLRPFETGTSVGLSSKHIIQKSISIFEDFEDIIGAHDIVKSVFIEVLINDFDIYFKKYIDRIKAISNNYKETNVLLDIVDHLFEMNRSLSNYYFKREQFGFGNIIYRELPEVVKRFIKIGEASKDDVMAVKIVEEIKCLKNISVEGVAPANPGTSYYASIVGPSFMGKTQTAFTLSHKINVIYVNLMSSVFPIDDPNNQPIYEPFKQFSDLFREAITKDSTSLEAANLDTRGEDLTHFREGYYTLGLLYLLIRSYSLKMDQSVEDRFLERINMKNALIPAFNVSEFKERLDEMNIDLDETLVFIDEIPRTDDNQYNRYIPKIRFLRNLCKATQIPSLLCGTNSQVNNLIGKSEYQVSGIARGAKKWVKVFTHPIRASLKSTCSVIKFNPYHDASRELTVCEFIDSNTGKFNFDAFKVDLFGPNYNSFPHLNSAMELLELVFKNMETSLPGIAFLSVKFIFDSLIQARDGEFKLETLWDSLIDHLMNEISDRKEKSLKTKFCVLASVHILTLPGIHKTANERGDIASRKVNEHYFYFGNRAESSFDLDLRSIRDNQIRRTTLNRNIILRDDNMDNIVTRITRVPRTDRIIVNSPKYGLFKGASKFRDECYFADICDDFLLCYSLWNLWYCTGPEEGFTLATLYEEYMKAIPAFPVEFEIEVPNSLSLEILGLWSIAYASHVDRLGNACGLDVLVEFIRNIQHFDDKDEVPVEKSFSDLRLPKSLVIFLDRIRVPYLISGPPPVNQTTLPDPHVNRRARIAKFIGDLASFMKIGTCHHPKNSVGWDVQFQIKFDGRDDIGCIECKLWKSPVGLPEIYGYYKKACDNQLKLFILVAKKIQVSLDKAGKFDKPTKVHSKNARHAKRVAIDNLDAERKKQNQHVEKMFGLWKNSKNRINLYSIRFKKETAADGLQIGEFSVTALKEHPRPTGVFILVESSFDPPLLSSSS